MLVVICHQGLVKRDGSVRRCRNRSGFEAHQEKEVWKVKETKIRVKQRNLDERRPNRTFLLHR